VIADYSAEETGLLDPPALQLELTSKPKKNLSYLWAFLGLALFLRLWVFHAFPSIYWADEIFQVQEPAHRIVYGTGVVTWEYRLGLRSWVLPGIVAGVVKATAWFAPGSSGYIIGTALFFSLLSLTTVWFAFSWCRQYFGLHYALLAAFTTTIWFELVDFGPRALSEVIAGNLLLPAIYWGALESNQKSENKKRMFFIGLLLGFSACLRVQLAPAVLLVALWIISRNWKARLQTVGAGMLAVLAIFGSVDALTWSVPFHSYFSYFTEDILHHRAAASGTLPWYYYVSALFVHTGPLVLFALVGVRRAPILGWISLAVLLPHSLIAHKEFRYIYPVLPILLTLSSIGLIDSLQLLARKSKWRLSVRSTSLVSAGVVLACSLGLSAVFPRWHKAGGDLRAFSRLSTDSKACGLAVLDIHWWDTGGYTYLNRPIPIFVFSGAREAASVAPAFNRIVAPQSAVPALPSYSLFSCQDGVCLYRREGACQTGGAEFEINEYLRRRGD
jgi:GPI mannosyltransferase 3